jgi:hypothetical protein
MTELVLVLFIYVSFYCMFLVFFLIFSVNKFVESGNELFMYTIRDIKRHFVSYYP